MNQSARSTSVEQPESALSGGKDDEKQEAVTLEKFLMNISNQKGHDDEAVGTHDFNMGGIAIHALIETIEFVLGCVSNTASYLRLWALSLAHSQIASVFFNMTLRPFVASNSSMVLLFVFPAFATATIAFLLVIDALECVLHCVRLHWVEFQNKFYDG